LILLKGSNTSDHLYRLALSRTMPVACWRMDCKKGAYCDSCELVAVPSHASASSESSQSIVCDFTDTALPMLGSHFDPQASAQVLIGLGNTGDAYRGTPHNVGHEMLDSLAESLTAQWRIEPEAAVATAEWLGQTIWLVKPRAAMNHSGSALRRLSERTGFRPEHCILVYDDLDLPLGAVRTRMRGSDGGHRGVRSILEAFQTDQFRRVKIGVKRAGDTSTARDAVLRPFDVEDRGVVDVALQQARENVRALVHPRPPSQHTRELSSPTDGPTAAPANPFRRL
jgi:aminoacyl-tRNA hydrolase